MEKREYLDFELRIQNEQGRYQATVLRSPAGEASYTFDLTFSELELENFVLRLGVTRRGIRRISSTEMGLLREFGSKLFEAVFRRDVRAGFISSQNEARRRGLGLRLKLRLDAPELLNIPWEYLYDTSVGRFLSLFESTPIVRYIDMREDVKPLRVKPPLSLLMMASSPKDQPPLDIAREQANLQKALMELVEAGMVTITWMEQATLPALVDTLLRGRYHVFHFIGHGGFDEPSQDGLLVLEDGSGGSHLVSGERMAVLLGNHPILRLAILNACEGARTSRDDPFAGTATTLLRTGGVPAVVAMQFSITDEAAITFSRGFYTALSVSRPVDAAATQARLAIFASGNDAEWGTPVLYMRSPDGRIFDVESLTPTQQAKRQREMEAQREREIAERQEQITALYASARGHLKAGRWPEAVAGFREVLDLDPTHGEAARQLAQAQAELVRQKAEERAQREEQARQDELARLVEQFKQGLTHRQAQRWREAIQAFQAVIEIEPEYGDPDHGTAVHLLAEALAEKERAELPPPLAIKPPAATAAPPQTTRRSRPTDLPR